MGPPPPSTQPPPPQQLTAQQLQYLQHLLQIHNASLLKSDAQLCHADGKNNDTTNSGERMRVSSACDDVASTTLPWAQAGMPQQTAATARRTMCVGDSSGNGDNTAPYALPYKMAQADAAPLPRNATADGSAATANNVATSNATTAAAATSLPFAAAAASPYAALMASGALPPPSSLAAAPPPADTTMLSLQQQQQQLAWALSMLYAGAPLPMPGGQHGNVPVMMATAAQAGGAPFAYMPSTPGKPHRGDGTSCANACEAMAGAAASLPPPPAYATRHGVGGGGMPLAPVMNMSSSGGSDVGSGTLAALLPPAATLAPYNSAMLNGGVPVSGATAAATAAVSMPCMPPSPMPLYGNTATPSVHGDASYMATVAAMYAQLQLLTQRVSMYEARERERARMRRDVHDGERGNGNDGHGDAAARVSSLPMRVAHDEQQLPYVTMTTTAAAPAAAAAVTKTITDAASVGAVLQQRVPPPSSSLLLQQPPSTASASQAYAGDGVDGHDTSARTRNNNNNKSSNSDHAHAHAVPVVTQVSGTHHVAGDVVATTLTTPATATTTPPHTPDTASTDKLMEALLFEFGNMVSDDDDDDNEDAAQTATAIAADAPTPRRDVTHHGDRDTHQEATTRSYDDAKQPQLQQQQQQQKEQHDARVANGRRVAGDTVTAAATATVSPTTHHGNHDAHSERSRGHDGHAAQQQPSSSSSSTTLSMTDLAALVTPPSGAPPQASNKKKKATMAAVLAATTASADLSSLARQGTRTDARPAMSLPPPPPPPYEQVVKMQVRVGAAAVARMDAATGAQRSAYSKRDTGDNMWATLFSDVASQTGERTSTSKNKSNDDKSSRGSNNNCNNNNSEGNKTVRVHPSAPRGDPFLHHAYCNVLRDVTEYTTEMSKQIALNHDKPSALCRSSLWPPHNQTAVRVLLKTHGASMLQRHLDILNYAQLHESSVQGQLDLWESNSIYVNNMIFTAYYVYVRCKSKRLLCMRHNSRRNIIGNTTGKCDYADNKGGGRCRYEHMCLFCSSKDHGWYDEKRCTGYQQLVQEVVRLGVTEDDMNVLLQSMCGNVVIGR